MLPQYQRDVEFFAVVLFTTRFNKLQSFSCEGLRLRRALLGALRCAARLAALRGGGRHLWHAAAALFPPPLSSRRWLGAAGSIPSLTLLAFGCRGNRRRWRLERCLIPLRAGRWGGSEAGIPLGSGPCPFLPAPAPLCCGRSRTSSRPTGRGGPCAVWGSVSHGGWGSRGRAVPHPPLPAARLVPPPYCLLWEGLSRKTIKKEVQLTVKRNSVLLAFCLLLLLLKKKIKIKAETSLLSKQGSSFWPYGFHRHFPPAPHKAALLRCLGSHGEAPHLEYAHQLCLSSPTLCSLFCRHERPACLSQSCCEAVWGEAWLGLLRSHGAADHGPHRQVPRPQEPQGGGPGTAPAKNNSSEFVR